MSKFKPYDKGQLMLLPPSVEDFIPEGHLARVVEQIVESLDTGAIEQKYSDLGQKSYSPKLLLKLLFYGYCTGVRSGRKIAMSCETDTAFMYLPNLYRPDFRTINDFRKDNLEVFEGFFKEVLLMCKALGMLKAGLMAIDGTKLSANASVTCFKTRQQYEEWDQQIEKQIKQVIDEADNNDRLEDQQYGINRGDELPEDLRNLKSLQSRIREVKEQMSDEGSVNFTDTDAKVIKSKSGLRPNYNCQTAVDENGIILAGYASNNASDKKQLTKVIQEAESNSEMYFEEIVADAGYSSYDNYQAVDQMGKKAYIPDQNYKQQKHDNPFHKSHFTYNSEEDTYTCPQGQSLVFDSFYKHKKHKQQSRLYKGVACDKCSKRPLCTKGKVRQIHQELREGLRQKARERLETPEGRSKMSKRKHLIESRFGHMKFNLKYDRLLLRGLTKVDAEYKLICTAMNILKIFKVKQLTQVA